MEILKIDFDNFQIFARCIRVGEMFKRYICRPVILRDKSQFFSYAFVRKIVKSFCLFSDPSATMYYTRCIKTIQQYWRQKREDTVSKLSSLVTLPKVDLDLFTVNSMPTRLNNNLDIVNICRPSLHFYENSYFLFVKFNCFS